jgi:sialate O-acetylesterase
VARTATHEGRKIAVRFDDVEKALVAYSAAMPIGFELCGQTSCRFAAAQIARGEIVLDVPAKFSPTHVRYCWGDGPICTLFDGAGLPAAPFDLPIGAARTARVLHSRPQARPGTLTKSAPSLR